MSQVLYRKWRPRHWDEVVSQAHIVQTLRNAVAGGHVGHAYLFAGPRGTGKTTMARLLAKAVNCQDEKLSSRPCNQCDHCLAINESRYLDLIEIDAASNTSVDDVRELRERINFRPNIGQYKIYIIDEVHMLSTAAFNALLKTLEEPPPHAIFILATTEMHKIPATVLSRCQRHVFRRVPITDITKHLTDLVEKEGLEITPDALTLIARQATGSLRDAVSLLDQLVSTGQPVNLELAQSILGVSTNQAVLEIITALSGGDTGSGLDAIQRSVEAGSDSRQLARQIVEYLRGLLLVRLGNANQLEVTPEVLAHMRVQAQAMKTADILSGIRNFNNAVSEARGFWQPTLPLEVAFLESVKVVPNDKQAVSQPLTTASVIHEDGSFAERVPTPLIEKTLVSGKIEQPELEKISVNAIPVNQEVPTPPQEVTNPTELEVMPTTEHLISNWRQILNLVRQGNPNTYGLLNSCKSRQLKGKVLYLGFASEVLRNLMVKKENLELIQWAVSEALKTAISVHCLVTVTKQNSLPTGVESDGMVAAAVRDLGGEVVDVQD